MRFEEIVAKLRALREIVVKRHNYSKYGPRVEEAEDLFTRYFAIRDTLRSEYPSLFADLPVRAMETWGEGKYITPGSLVTLSFDLDYCLQLLKDAENLDMSAVSTNVFKREGKRWFIAYDGKTLRPNDMKGLNYIAYLLGNRDKDIHVLDLLEVITERDVDSRSEQYRSMTSEQLQEEGLTRTAPTPADDVLDAQARAEYRHKITDLEIDLQVAQEDNDQARITSITDEIEFIRKQLAHAYGIGGGRRTGDMAETARKAIARCIKTSIKRIRKEHESLADHLFSFIKTGKTCSYTPEKPVSWLL